MAAAIQGVAFCSYLVENIRIQAVLTWARIFQSCAHMSCLCFPPISRTSYINSKEGWTNNIQHLSIYLTGINTVNLINWRRNVEKTFKRDLWWWYTKWAWCVRKLENKTIVGTRYLQRIGANHPLLVFGSTLCQCQAGNHSDMYILQKEFLDLPQTSFPFYRQIGLCLQTGLELQTNLSP